MEFGEKLCTPMKKARKEEKESGKGRSFFSLWFFFSPAIKSNRPSTPSIIMISSPPMQRAIDLHPRFIIIALDIFSFLDARKKPQDMAIDKGSIDSTHVFFRPIWDLEMMIGATRFVIEKMLFTEPP